MNKTLEKNNNCSRILTLSLLLFPFANVYLIVGAGLGFGEVLMLCAIIVIIFKNGFKVRIDFSSNMMTVFFLYVLIITVVMAMIYPSIEVSETLKRVVRDGFYILIIWGFARHYFNYQYGYKVLNIFAVILSVFILIQFVAYLLFKLYIPGFVNGLTIDAGTAALYKQKALTDAAILGYLRPNGFLAEPAQCAHFLSFAILVNLMSEGVRSKNRKKLIGLFTLATICSTSLNGIVLLVAAYGIYFLIMMKSSNTNRFIRSTVAFVFFIVIALIAYFKIPYIQNIVSRIGNISTTTTGSTAMRTMRGWVFFSQMPFLDKITGIGFGNFLGYREANAIWTAYEEGVEYFNTDAYILISAGIIGCIILMIAIYRYIKKGDSLTFAIFALLFVMGLSSSIYSTPIMAIALSFALFREGS